MLKWSAFFPPATSIVLILYSIPVVYGSGDHPWCYNEEKCAPANWGGMCKLGKSQSPIDLDLSGSINPATGKLYVAPTSKLHDIHVNEAYLQGYSEFFVKNNGHTVQLQLREDLTSSLKISSDGFGRLKYQLSQLHFHWGSNSSAGSEHTVNGTSYPMELHLVHFSEKYSNLLQAVQDKNPRALAVFAIFFDITPEDNPALTPIVEAVATVASYQPDPQLFKPSAPLNLSAFFPENMEVFRYVGSLTTPSCGERVVWTVCQNPIPISEKQMQAFRNVKDTFDQPLLDNFRPIQPIGPRRIYRNTAQLLKFPEDVSPEVRIIDSSKEFSKENEGGEKNSSREPPDTDSHQPRNETAKERSSSNRILNTCILPITVLILIFFHLI